MRTLPLLPRRRFETMFVDIKTEEQNDCMLALVERLMDKSEELSTAEEKLLKLLARLIEDFEVRYYRPRDATPLEVAYASEKARKPRCFKRRATNRDGVCRLD